MTDLEIQILTLHTCESLNATSIQRILEIISARGYTLSFLQDKHVAEMGFRANTIHKITQHIAQFDTVRILEELRAHNITPIFRHDANYPTLLKEIHDPPHVLFVKGDLHGNLPFVSVVGTRHPTPYGTYCTKTMTSSLVASGFGIVSGLAHGIDSIAHQEALGQQGYTIAVLAHGHNTCTPREHTLATHIIDSGGAVITEYLPQVPALKHFFPIRNRIIAGISRATLVPECNTKSGTMITASCALRENRDVLAIPGLISNPYAEGPHQLISQGAACIYSPVVLQEALGIHTHSEQSELPFQTLSPEAQKVLACLRNQSLHLDDLLEISALPLPILMRTLRLLEHQKHIEQRPGNTFGAI